MDDQLPLFGSLRRKEPTPKEPDALFDALMFVTKTNPKSLTASGRGMANRALKEIRDAGGTPEDVIHRSRAYVERWRHTPTVGALARHWAALEVRPHAARRVEPLVREEASETLTQAELRVRVEAWRESRRT